MDAHKTIMRLYSYIVIISCTCLLNCTAGKNAVKEKEQIAATDLKPYGRFSYTADGRLELISSAVHFGFSFSGKQCSVYLSIPSWLDHNYLQYELDGVYQKRIRIGKDSSMPIVLSASNDGPHIVWIYKATEAATGAVYIRQIAGSNIKALP